MFGICFSLHLSPFLFLFLVCAANTEDFILFFLFNGAIVIDYLVPVFTG